MNPSKGTKNLLRWTTTLVGTVSAGLLACTLGSGCVTAPDDESGDDTDESLESRVAAPVGAVKGTKWYPGAYLEVGSPGMTKSGATNWDEAPYTTFLDLPNSAGYMLNVGWVELEAKKGVYTLDVIGTVLDYAHARGKKVILVVYDRSFAGDTSGHLPDYLKNVGPGKMDCSFVTSSGKRRSLKWYKPACVNRIVSLYSEIGKSYDAHPALAGVSVGYLESAIEESDAQPDFNDLDTLSSEQLRGAVDSKPSFPTTPVGVGGNWAQNLLQRGQYYGAHKGFAFFHPDSLPGEWYGVDKDKNGQPDATQAEVLWKGKVPTFAKSEQTFVDESIPNIEKKQWDFQVNTIGASFFVWTPATKIASYVQNRVLPFMKTNPKMPAANLACPTTYVPCITK